jgi:glucose/arabinose dehydrogenase
MEDVFPGLKFEQPLDMVSIAGDKKRLFILERTGRVQMITGLDGDEPEKKLFLDLTHPRDGALDATGECGTLGLAFPPDHAKSGQFYVYYSLRIDGKLQQRLSRFHVLQDEPDRSDSSTEQPLFTQLDPASNHNGGDLHFGPDGYLYASVGDGGGANDQFNTANFINNGFFAAILRIDVNQSKDSLPPNPHAGVALDAEGKAFYSIPADNPFIGVTSHHGLPVDPKTVRTEIWATGLRNPWRFSFDSPTGRLFAGDVGQNLYEEVDLIVKGGDYGWSYREGLHAFAQGPGGAKEPPNFKPILPIFEYPHPLIGVSVTGGVVYRGQRLPQLEGKYVFADYGTGRIMALRDVGEPLWLDETLAQEAGIVSIAPDPRDGELLFANFALGKIKRLKLKTNPTSIK